MAETQTKLPTKQPKIEAPREWEPFDDFRREIDRAFDVFRRGFWRSSLGRSVADIEPFWRGEAGSAMSPAVDIIDKADRCEIRAELPGLDASNIDLQFADGILTIKGEKKEQKEEKKEDFYVSELRYGTFQRSFVVPQGVDPAKIEASFKNGVLSVTMAKAPKAENAQKKIPIKAAG